jgi:hypothetical protein
MAESARDNEKLSQLLNLSHTGYYSRVSSLARANLVKRKGGGNYIMTSFGRIVNDAIEKIGRGLENEWKFRTIDSINSKNDLPQDEYKKLIQTLIIDPEIRKIILNVVRT